MSATGRNLVGHERRLLDFYPTPASVTRAVLPHLAKPATALEPAAGDGAILRVLRDAWPDVQASGFEVEAARATKAGVECRNALEGPWPRVDLVITNPPFGLLDLFLHKALYSGATEVAFLLRLGFVASAKRASLHRNRPSDMFVLSKRPSFAFGSTDMADYAWFVWGPGRGGRWQILGDA